MKNILFLTPRFIVGGAERYILVKSKWLVQHGYNVIVASEGGVWESKLKDIGVIHYKLDWINKNPKTSSYEDNIKRLAELNNIIRENNIEIIEANQLYPAIYVYYLSKITNVKFLVNVLSEISFLDNRNIEFIKELNDRNLYYNIADSCNGEIERANNVKFDRCVSLPIPMEIDSDIKIANGKYILTVCRMAKEKMYVKYLIKDFKKLCLENELKNYNLIIVGDGPLYKEVEKMAISSNGELQSNNCKIIMNGTVTGDDLEELYKNCDIYVGMGTTLLSAASYKKPSIIATFYPNDITEAYGYFGQEYEGISIGQIVNGMKKDSYSNYIVQLLRNNDLYKDIAIKGYNLVNDNFELNVVMNKWINEYEKIMINFRATKGIYKENEKIKTKIKKAYISIKH